MAEENLPKLEDEKGVMQFLQEPTVRIAEILTGVLVSDTKDYKLSAGKIVQSVIKGQLLTQLGRELDEYRKKGLIKEDYFATHKNRASLYELLKFLDEEVPDDELFTAIKSIFLSGINKEADGADEVLAYEFLLTAKQLSGTEILILKANYEIAQEAASDEVKATYKINRHEESRDVWAAVVAAQMGYPGLASIALKHEENLETQGLIRPRRDREDMREGYRQTEWFRLTEMGCKFCEFMTRYE